MLAGRRLRSAPSRQRRSSREVQLPLWPAAARPREDPREDPRADLREEVVMAEMAHGSRLLPQCCPSLARCARLLAHKMQPARTGIFYFVLCTCGAVRAHARAADTFVIRDP